MDKRAKKRKQEQAHKHEHAVPENILKEEFGPEFGDPNAAKAFENAIEAQKDRQNKKKKC